MKGIIALDIDGTITTEHHTVSLDVARFLTELAKEGWILVFVTGRTFKWGYDVLSNFHFPYFFAVQNGAIILEMPSRTIRSKKYLDREIIPNMEEICKEEPSDFVIYTGYENHDKCYYRPNQFDFPLKEYVEERTRSLKESWIPLNSYDHFPIKEFPSVKCFGDYDSAIRMATQMESQLNLHVPIIRDPFNEEICVVQGTHPEVNKGYAIKDVQKIIGEQGFVIAAGDDQNDIPMLKIAHVKVVMATAPLEIRQMADIIAPPAEELGIIRGLTEALAWKRF